MDLFRSQFTKIPKLKPVNLSKSTVLVTGANGGLGLEAEREIHLSKPERLILAVRGLEKGKFAQKELENPMISSTQIDIRKLDRSSFRSVQNFAKELEVQRVDIAILDAGMKHFVIHSFESEFMSFYRNMEHAVHSSTRRTGLVNQTSGVMGLVVKLMMLSVGRSAPDGARCLVVAAVSAPQETYGRYLSEIKIKDESELIRGKQRDGVGKKLWNEIIDFFTQHGLNAQRGFPGNA